MVAAESHTVRPFDGFRGIEKSLTIPHLFFCSNKSIDQPKILNTSAVKTISPSLKGDRILDTIHEALSKFEKLSRISISSLAKIRKMEKKLSPIAVLEFQSKT